jgi:chemotaxis protein MotA
MDLATIIGMVLGYGLVFFAILSKPGAAFFVDAGSAFIVVGGTAGALLMSFPMGTVATLQGTFMKYLMHKDPSMQDSIQSLVSIAEKARREGILAIEQSLAEIDDDFMKSGLRLAVDGTEPETIKAIMEIELNSMISRHQDGSYTWMQIGTFGPAFGMIGTLIGLIQMLQALDDPSKIGLGMGTALITTLYGALIANLVAMPINGKLVQRAKEELARKELVVEGILAIQNGDNPRLVGEKLYTYLPPSQREKEEVSE